MGWCFRFSINIRVHAFIGVEICEDYLAAVKMEPVKKAQPVAEGKRYRVQAGAFSSRAKAETLLTKVRSSGFIDAYITEN